MIIDFHTHIFPDLIAEKTITKLETLGHIKAFTDGTLEGLVSSMESAKITHSVVLPVVTKPSQFHTINEFAASINGKHGLIAFGGIHPDNENYTEKLEYIKHLGLKGIKLHPDYQNTLIDDERYLELITLATEKDLIVSIHAGLDVGYPDTIHCTPLRTLTMLSYVYSHSNHPNPNIVLVHTGGYALWEEVLYLLVGKKVYFDMSFTLPFIPTELFLEIVRKHGSDRILFATDSPWGGQKETLDQFLSLPFSKEEQNAILYQNAAKLLNIDNR